MSKLTQNDVFIVSGGVRGITAQCVIKLAQSHPCNFILLGRSQFQIEPQWTNNITDEIKLKKQAFLHFSGTKKPAQINNIIKEILAQREIQQTLQTIKKIGGKAEYITVDITNSAELLEKITPVINKFGQITGIIHGAGVLADKLIENKTEQDFEKVYNTKIQGLQSLLNCVNLSELKYLILFSSAAGFFGNIGQSDYAIANEILNKFAHNFKYQYPKCKVISFNWGPWESGMVTPELKKLFSQRGIDVIPVDMGTEIFVNQILNGNYNQVQILVGSELVTPSLPLETELKTYRIRRKLTLKNNPFLQDHIIGNHAVLPTVFASVWLGNTAEQIYLGYKFFSIENFKVLKGIVFDDTLANEYILDIKEIKKIPQEEIEVSATIWSETKDRKLRYHYQGKIRLLKQIPPRPIYKNFDDQQVDQLINLSPYQDGTLFHGVGFQGVKQILNMSHDQIKIKCIYPEVKDSYLGQFPHQAFNALELDSAFQSMLIWTKYFCQTASLPLKCQKGEYFKNIPLGTSFYVSMEVKLNNNSKLIADVSLYDEQGNIYSRVFGAEVIMSKELNHLFETAKNNTS